MPAFVVPDMHCDGCIRSITAAIREADPGATVTADLATHRVDVASAAPAAALLEALRDAGFTPEAAS